MVAPAKPRPAVLIVEDEALVRLDMAEHVAGLGYRVLEAANADEAIGALNARSDIRLVLTDVDMPGSMDGLSLARFVLRRWPPIRVLVVSGHVDVSKSDLPEGAEFCPKPCPPERLNMLLGALMNS
jgi:CheY-like chemotaxis protein